MKTIYQLQKRSMRLVFTVDVPARTSFITFCNFELVRNIPLKDRLDFRISTMTIKPFKYRFAPPYIADMFSMISNENKH